MDRKLRIALSGIGNRALPKKPETSNWLGWTELIKNSQYFQLVAAHDISGDSIKRIVERGYLKPEQTFEDLDIMLKRVSCDAVLVTNPADCHAATIRKILDYNLDLLIEKPVVVDLDEGERLIDLIEKKDRVAAVIQNWRSKDAGRLLGEAIQSGMAGKIGHIFFRYIRDRENPNYPPYIFQERHPLLYAMGIHHLDLFRHILKDEYVSISGHSFKPPWTLYKYDTGLNLFLKTREGVAILYSGTISSKNKGIEQESLVIEGEKGSFLNESAWLEPPLWFYPQGKKGRIDLAREVKARSIAEQYDISDSCILENFYRAVKRQEKPICSASDGLRSVAVLEASRLACETGKTIYLR